MHDLNILEHQIGVDTLDTEVYNTTSSTYPWND